MIVKIIAFLIILSFSTPALAEGYWNNHLLTQIEKEPLSSQKGINLVSYHYVNNNLSDDENNIICARIIGDRIVAWFGDSIDSNSLINVYDISGKFLYGYQVNFDYGNGLINLNLQQDDILVYFTSARCIYRFSSTQEEVKYFHASPEQANFFLLTDRDLYGDDHLPRIKSFQNGLLEFYNSQGEVIILADSRDAYNIRNQNTKTLNWVVAALGISLPLLLIAIDIYKNTYRPNKK